MLGYSVIEGKKCPRYIKKAKSECLIRIKNLKLRYSNW